MLPSNPNLTVPGPRSDLGAGLGLAALALSLATGCQGASSPSSSPSAGPSTMRIQEVSHGFGLILPHQTLRLDSNGNPTSEVVSLRSLGDLSANVTATNPIFPAIQWPETPVLPNGDAGNHFLYVEFNSAIDIDSVLSSTPGAVANSSLSGTVTVLATDPVTKQPKPVRGRVMIHGSTYGGQPTGSPPQLEWQTWVELDASGQPSPVVLAGAQTPGFGFPGTTGTGPLSGASKLMSAKTLVFIVDEDDDLSTFETFPAGAQVSMRITNGVLSLAGKALVDAGFASSTVGPDTTSPEVAQSAPPFSIPSITPGNGEQGVDPLQNIIVQFTEPIQPHSVAPLPVSSPPTLGAAIQVQFGPSAQVVDVPFFIQPLTPFDLTRMQLLPSFNFPGAGADGEGCGSFNRISVTVNAGQVGDLAAESNVNQSGVNTFYLTGSGPGLVNAPVAPDSIYVARIGADTSISVIDLNGNGASTGNPAFDAANPMIKGNSRYPLNPNVALLGTTLFPPLAPGDCTYNGGSSGVFSLTKDSNLSDQLASSPLFESVGDFMLGHALDSTYNNGPPPYGCQAGGGNICATTGIKLPNPVLTGPNTIGPASTAQFGTAPAGSGNLVSWAPHPNPPPLSFPPLCISPYIGGQEPTSIDTIGLPTNPTGIVSLLVPGAFPQGNPTLGLPPQGTLAKEKTSFFVGPSAPQTQISSCLPYQIRQQIGHYLYVVDRIRREVVVLNSNRFHVIDRIPVPDPTSLAMSPNLTYLAVTNRSAGTVTFIDIDPTSPSLHEAVKTTVVGAGPVGIAWEPDNEDILVCNEAGNSVSIISATSLEVRKTVSNQLSAPFEVAITPRQLSFGFNRQVYFAYIIGRNGKVSLFESGPDGSNGWGFDDIVGQPPMVFPNPKAMQPDHIALQSGVWIAHERSLGLDGHIVGAQGTGAVSNMLFEATTAGPLPLKPGLFGGLIDRNIQFRIGMSLGVEQLTGVPTDLA
ncbi:MAG: hypothetical protein ACI9C2_001912, partial [Gammaproteobacteria bacterium]